MYETMMLAIKNLDIVPILVFLAGAIIGIVLFSNVLSWFFKKFKMPTLAALTGFMLWSLNKIWPWKDSVYSEWWTWRNVLPGQFENITWESNQLLWAIICFIVGILIVLLIEFLGNKFSKKK